MRSLNFLIGVGTLVVRPTSSFSVNRSQWKSRVQSSDLIQVSSTSQDEDLELTRKIIMQNEQESTSVIEEPVEDKPDLHNNDRPANDLMIRAALGETTERTPIWLFRQAGRHLPEYQQYKKDTGKNFLQLLDDPACVAECTMQPVRRYDLDAAILFSDILVIAEALGVEVTMPGGVGIQVPNPIESPEDMGRLPKIEEAGTREFVENKLGHVIQAVKSIRKAMTEEGKSIPLIGFSAAPWTLMYYMLGGSSKKNTEIGVQWLKDEPEASNQLLDLLTAVVIEYMSAQVAAGAHMLQVFEAMGMMIDDANFESSALPCLKKIATELKSRHPDIPLMVFCRGACHLNNLLTDLGYDVITIDGSVKRDEIREIVGPNITVQGNYDPSELIPENGKTVDTVKATAREMLEALGPARLIANLGEGLGGKESPELVDAFVKAIHDESEQMLQK